MPPRAGSSRALDASKSVHCQECSGKLGCDDLVQKTGCIVPMAVVFGGLLSDVYLNVGAWANTEAVVGSCWWAAGGG